MKVFLVVLLVGFVAAAPPPPALAEDDQQGTPGGLSGPNEEPASPEVKKIVKDLKNEIIVKITELNGNVAPTEGLEAIAYKTQQVAGTNYFVKVRTGDKKNWFCRIHENLDDKCSLDKCIKPKNQDDQVEYFE